MQHSLSRRTVVAGVAWSAPVVVASSAIPAFATSRPEPCLTDKTFNSRHIPPAPVGNTRTKTTDHWTVPEGVYQIKFYVRGGAGGSTMGGDSSHGGYGGAGAEVSGYVDVTPGEVLTFVVGASGTAGLDGQPAAGGEGFGNGGASNALPAEGLRADVQQDFNNYNLKNLKVQYSGSGGGASAIVRLNPGLTEVREVIAIAGGGGGAGMTVENHTENYPHKGRKDASILITNRASGGMQVDQSLHEVNGGSELLVDKILSTDGGGENITLKYYPDFTEKTAGGKGSGTATEGSSGQGGDGAPTPEVDQLRVTAPYLTYATINADQGNFIGGDSDGAVYASRFAGQAGDSTDDPKNPVDGAAGVPAWGAVQTNPGHYPQDWRDRANYYIYGVSGGGGGGFGGGGSGNAIGQGVRVTAEGHPIDNDGSTNFHYSGAFVSGGAGGAGGSYLAPQVTSDSKKFWAHANRTSHWRNGSEHGQIQIHWCDPSGPHV